MTELAALAVQPSTFDPMKALLVASQLRQADAQNTLANLTIQDRQDAKNGLAEYSRMDAAGDPGGAMRALTKASPQMAMHIMQLKKSGVDLDNEITQQTLVKNGRDAMAVASMPEGPERDAAWQDRLKIAANEKRITPEQYESMRQQKPNSLMLNRIVMNGLSLEQYIAQTNKQEDRAESAKFLDAAKNINNPNANRTVPQATSGAISPLAVDPSQGLPDDSFNTPLSPGARVSPQQVAQARTQPQLDPNSGMVTPATAPVPYMTPVGPNGDNAMPSASPIGGSPAASAAAPTAASPNTQTTPGLTKGRVQPSAPQMDRGALLTAAAQMAGGDKSRLFDFFLAGSVNPNKQVADVSKEMLKIVSDDSKTPDDLKKYSVYLRQMDASGNFNKADDFTTWDRKNRAASAKETTIIDKSADKLTTSISDTLGDVYKDGIKAGQDLVGIGRLGKLIENSGTGANVAFTNFVRENLGEGVASVFGGKKIGAIEATNAYLEQMAPTLRMAGSGSQSDTELRGFKRSLPTLMSSVDGRRIIIETLGGMAEFRQQRGDIVADFHSKIQRGEINEETGKPYVTSDIDKAFKKLGDPFAKFKEYQAALGGKAGVNAPALTNFSTPDDAVTAFKAGNLKRTEKITAPNGETYTVDDILKARGL